jgi:hypothetical protein
MERLGERMGVFFPVLALTGCALATDAPTSPPVTGSRSAGPTSAPQIGGPVTSGTVSLSVRSIAGAGSFPRSFLIPGTDTSIRIGGS